MKGNLVNDARLAALVAAVSDLLAAMARASDLDRAAVLNARIRCRDLVDEITANAASKSDRAVTTLSPIEHWQSAYMTEAGAHHEPHTRDRNLSPQGPSIPNDGPFH